MLLSLLTVACALTSPISAYSSSASASLTQLAAQINQTTASINHLEGCGYTSTTEAISNGATVTGGSACPSADAAIARNLTDINSALQASTASLQASRSSSGATSAQVGAAFSDFANGFYALFNAMDLAECTYILTTSSESFAAQFGTGALKDSFDALVGELSTSVPLAVQLLGPNFKQQTHFLGTSFLATQVGGLKPLALAGCDVITGIVTSEGGGSS